MVLVCVRRWSPYLSIFRTACSNVSCMHACTERTHSDASTLVGGSNLEATVSVETVAVEHAGDI